MTRKSSRLSVLFIASEADPFAKIGGLGDVAGSLPLAVRGLSDAHNCYDIRIAIPLYGFLKQKYPELTKEADFKVNTGSLSINAAVYSIVHHGMTVYFISGGPINENEPVYGTNFIADAEKFIFFSLACLELPRVLKWKIDILHCNDWHTAIAIHQLEKMRLFRPGYSKIKSVLTLHNLPFMGSGSEDALTMYGIEPAQDPTLPVWARMIPLPMGLSSADRIIAVSPAYANELLTPEYGCGLETFFYNNQTRLSGILNGIDHSIWDPNRDPVIDQKFNLENIQKKGVNKKALQKEMGLTVDPAIPLIVIISRMDSQKGIDLAFEALRQSINQNWQCIILGSGDANLEKSALSLEMEFPQRIRAKITFDSVLSHRMYAGADMLFMPSRYEPCGLSQLIAMRYGTVPIARATGGLKDTIIDASFTPAGNGFLFEKADSIQATIALTTAMETFHRKKRWKEIIHNAMDSDFSWTASAKKYSDLYLDLFSS